MKKILFMFLFCLIMVLGLYTPVLFLKQKQTDLYYIDKLDCYCQLHHHSDSIFFVDKRGLVLAVVAEKPKPYKKPILEEAPIIPKSLIMR